MKRFILIAFCLILSLCLTSGGAQQSESSAKEADASDFEYKELEDGTLSITKYKGKSSSIQIPEKIDGKTVSRIGDHCFSLDLTVSNIILPETVTVIEKRAFDSATKLESVTIKAKSILFEERAFNATNLSTLIIESEKIIIGESAFSLCTKLKDLTISKAKSINMAERAFASDTGIKSISLTADEIFLVENAFTGCENLKSVEIKCVNLSFGENVFMGCRDLNSVEIKCANLSISKEGFVLCTGLNSFIVDNKDENTKLQNVSIGDECFSSCDITTFRIAGGKVTIGDEAFKNNVKLTEIHVPSGTILGKDIFKLCWKNPIVIYDE